MEKTKAVKYPNNYARSIPHSKGEIAGLEITDMRIDDHIIKGPVVELIKEYEEKKSKARPYVNLADESQAAFSLRTAAPPIADLICEIGTLYPERIKHIDNASPYCYMNLEWEEFCYFAIDNESRLLKYLLSLVNDLVDGSRAWVIDFGTGKGEIAKPFFISDVQTEEIKDSRLWNLKQYKEEGKAAAGIKPSRIKSLTLFFYKKLFQPCWADVKGKEGAGYLFSDHAFTANFLRAYDDLLSGRTEESQAFLSLYNPQKKEIINTEKRHIFDSRLFAMAIWFMIHAEANVDKPFAQRIRKDSEETIAMLQQVSPSMIRSAGKGKDRVFYIRNKIDAQIFIDKALWVLNYGARQGFFEHFKAIPTSSLYERGKRASDFCFEIKFECNTPRGEEKTMRGVTPYSSNLTESLIKQNPLPPPIEGATPLWL